MKSLEEFAAAMKASNIGMIDICDKLDKIEGLKKLHTVKGTTACKVLFDDPRRDRYIVKHYTYVPLEITESWISYYQFEKWNDDQPEMEDKKLHEEIMDLIEKEGF